VEVGNVIKTVPAGGEQLAVGERVILYVSVTPGETAKVKVPDLKSWTLKEAKAMLEQRQLVLDSGTAQEIDSTEEKGKIVWQSIDPNTEVDPKTNISVKISNGVPPSQSGVFTIPLPVRNGDGILKIYLNEVKSGDDIVVRLSGSTKVTLTSSGASVKLEATLDDLTIYTATVDFTKNPPTLSNEQTSNLEETVSSPNYTHTTAATEEIPAGETPGEDWILMPDVVGKSKEAALELLADLGFINVTTQPSSLAAILGNKVVRQSAVAETKVAPDRLIILYLSN
jgi:serine/threonine-protein kinase